MHLFAPLLSPPLSTPDGLMENIPSPLIFIRLTSTDDRDYRQNTSNYSPSQSSKSRRLIRAEASINPRK
jgi:hypothetical protein